MSAYASLLVRPLLAGFAAGLLIACSVPDSETVATDSRSSVQDQPAHKVIASKGEVADSTIAPAAAPGVSREAVSKATRQQSAHLSIPMPAQDALSPGYHDAGREQYQAYAENPVYAVSQTPVSTFSIDVDTGSYANVRRFLNDGQLPPKDAVRLEELVNYFNYTYPLPKGDVPFGVSTELTTTPWNPQSRLLRIAIKASDLTGEQLPPANLVFLVDVSGSMQRRDGLPLVQSTLKLLVDQLRPQDRVSLVTYAGSSQVVLESTLGSDKVRIRAAIDQLTAGGSTAGESGIQLAYQQAQKHLLKGGINRILLATDGDFNVGISDFDTLRQMAADQRKTGVSLTTLGFGTDNYNERLMEQLADAGDGNYAYIDNLREARKVLVEQLSSTLATVASDVKIQVEFNPAEVSEYRLLGYSNRLLNTEDFNNDRVDAGEIGAGHTVTALYELVPAGGKGWLEPLRYQPLAEKPGRAGELAWLRLRYKVPGQRSSRLLEQPIVAGDAVPLARTSDDMRFAAAVAAFAQQLQGGQYTGQFSLADSAELARQARGEDAYGLRGEFVQLVELASSLQNSSNLATLP